MKLIIKQTVPEDIPAILVLMREFAEYENLLEYLEVTEEKLHDVLFGNNCFVKSLMAFDNTNPIAYSLFYQSFLSFRGQRSVYLEDIFITEKYRKYGVGEKLIRKIAKEGKRFGAVRMDFQVLAWNKPAINFYKKHGALVDEEERHFKFTNEAFEKLTED